MHHKRVDTDAFGLGVKNGWQFVLSLLSVYIFDRQYVSR